MVEILRGASALGITYIVAELIIGALSIFGNSLVVITICQNNDLRTVTNVLVMSLAFSDIAVGLFVIPLEILTFYGWPPDFYGCLLAHMAHLPLTNVSLLSLVTITLERFLAIKEPFVYQRMMTVGRTKRVCVFVWTLGMVLGYLPPLVGWRQEYKELKYCQFWKVVSEEFMFYFRFTGMIAIPLLLMLVIYGYIVLVVRQHMRRSRGVQLQFQLIRFSKDADTGDSVGNKVIKDNRMFNKDVRAAWMFALVIVAFAVCWLPINILNTITFFCRDACPIPLEFIMAGVAMTHANSFMNPVLYATSNSRIRHAMMELLGWKRQDQYYTNSERSIRSSQRTSVLHGSISQRSSLCQRVTWLDDAKASVNSSSIF